MGKKSKKNRVGIVYSTNPEFDYSYDENEQETLEPAHQKLTITLDRKQRRGKEVTLISGFLGRGDDLKDLAKFLKSKCGTGGSAKEGQIIIQGNFKDKVFQILKVEGYTQTKVR